VNRTPTHLSLSLFTFDKTPLPLSNEGKTNDVSRSFFEEKERSEMGFRC
jgi:hypothetical protein